MTLFIYKNELDSLLDSLKKFAHADAIIAIEIDDKDSKLQNYLLKVTFEACNSATLMAIYRAGYAQAEKEISQNKIK
jgi:hypothetical protein